MVRLARLVVPGVPHHITHRGNRQENVFFDDTDRLGYLKRLAHYGDKYGLRIWSYCLMSNHIHLLGLPLCEDSLALAIGRTHMQHARAVNKRHGWTGHLWANRFFSSVTDPRGVPMVARYIELNPVRAGLVNHACDYSWSSARANCETTVDPLLDSGRDLSPPTDTWALWLQEAVESEDAATIRRNTFAGRPIGSQSFVAALEADTGRRLTRRRYLFRG